MLNGYLPQLIIGLGITIRLAFCALILGLVLGLIGAAGESSKKAIIRYFFVTFHSIIRGVPELLVLFFVYFGGTEILSKLFHQNIQVNSFIAGVVALGLLFGTYASQTLRGAFLAIPPGQTEAAKALALSRWQTFYLILLPQAWRHALSGIGNLWLVLLKDTALVSLIGLADLMMRTQNAAITTARPFTFYMTAAIIYLLLTSISEITLLYFNKRANRYLKPIKIM